MDLIVRNHVIEAPMMEILEKLREETNNKKLRKIDDKGTWISVPCPFHSDGNESHNSCGVVSVRDGKKEYGTFNCFACGEKGRLPKFVAGCLDISIEQGEDWLIKHFGNVLAQETYILPTIEIKPKKRKINVLDEGDLDKLQKYHPYMTQRKLTQEVCERFKVRYDPSIKSIVFPVWDEKGNYIFNTSRSVEFKYFSIPEDVKKPVYLLNFILKAGIREVVVCESQINTLTCWSYGIPAIGLFGTGDDYQYDILNNTNIIRYILALDGDNAGKKGIERFKNNIKKSAFVDVIEIPKGEDVNSLDREKFIQLYNAIK